MALITKGSIIGGCVTAVLTAGCNKPPTSPSPTPPVSPAQTYSVTTLSFTSDAADYVGRGRSETFTLQNASFAANVYGNGEHLAIAIRTASTPSTHWTLIVDAPFDNTIVPGTYETRRAYGSGDWTVDFGGDGRGCGTIYGRVVIHAFDFIRENRALKHFRASFEQKCEGTLAALRGEVAVLADPWR